MSTPENPASTPAAGHEKNVTPGTEEKLQQFWARNRKGVMVLCVLVLLGIVGKGGWDYLAAEKEQSVQKAYATAATPAQLQAFAEANAGHELAGVAWLQVGDQAYADNKGAEAVTAYQKAAALLGSGPLADRTALGIAMAQLQAGQTDAGTAGLKQLVDQEHVFKGVRAEAAYQLASLANAAGRSEDVRNYAERVMQIDPASPWAQRALNLNVALAVAGAKGISGPVSISSPASAAAEPVIKLNLPGGK